MRTLFFLILFLPTALTGCRSEERGNAEMERCALDVVDALLRRDEVQLNTLVDPGSGVIFLYAPGVAYTIVRMDSVSFDSPLPGLPDGWAEGRLEDIGLHDTKIKYEPLPEYDCGEDRWNKPEGIYCDTTTVDRRLSDIAAIDNDLVGEEKRPESDIAGFRGLEDNSRKIVAIGPTGHFIFYLTRRGGDWRLSVIELYDPCSA